MAPPTPRTASPGRKGGENWDLDKALEFIEGAKSAPQSNKKAKKKKKKLTGGSGDKLEQINTTEDSTSNEEQKNNTIESHPKGNTTSTARVNSDSLKDGCMQKSETLPVGEVKGGTSGLSYLRSKPSVLSCPPGVAGNVEESEAPRNLKVEAMQAPMESKVKGCMEKVQE